MIKRESHYHYENNNRRVEISLHIPFIVHPDRRIKKNDTGARIISPDDNRFRLSPMKGTVPKINTLQGCGHLPYVFKGYSPLEQENPLNRRYILGYGSFKRFPKYIFRAGDDLCSFIQGNEHHINDTGIIVKPYLSDIDFNRHHCRGILVIRPCRHHPEEHPDETHSVINRYAPGLL